MPSPYFGQPVENWKAITKTLVESHPLDFETIREIAEKSWRALWKTTIGKGNTAIRLSEIVVPATVVGYFFEKLFAKELESRFPGKWRGNQSKDEKDFVYIPDAKLSVEMKTSGQAGTKIFGNRSYGQRVEDEGLPSKPEKSGYYITANFYGKALGLLRFGWIDVDDWKPQSAQTGQAASLKKEVYQNKLIEIGGDYRLNAPTRFLEGIGERTAKNLEEKEIKILRELLTYEGNEMQIIKFKEKVQQLVNQEA